VVIAWSGMCSTLANGVRVRLSLGDPESDFITERGQEEGIGDAMAAKVRNARTLFRPLAKCEAIEIRLHNTVLYNSLYRADEQLFVNQHAYGVPAAHSPVFCLRESERGEMVGTYLDSFERVWVSAEPIQRQPSQLSLPARRPTHGLRFDVN